MDAGIGLRSLEKEGERDKKTPKLSCHREDGEGKEGENSKLTGFQLEIRVAAASLNILGTHEVTIVERKQEGRGRHQPGEGGRRQLWKRLQAQGPPTSTGPQGAKKMVLPAEQRIKKGLSLLSLAELIQLRTKEYSCWPLDGLASTRLKAEATSKWVVE